MFHQRLALRHKVLLLLLAGALLLSVATLALAHLILRPQVIRRELELALQRGDRFAGYIARDLQQLSDASLAHGAWDEAHDFLAHGAPGFADRNFGPKFFEHLPVDGVLYLDMAGAIRMNAFRRGPDAAAPPLDPAVATMLRKHLLQAGSRGIQRRTSLITASGRLYLAAASPVTTADGRSAVAGWCVFLRQILPPVIEHWQRNEPFRAEIGRTLPPQRAPGRPRQQVFREPVLATLFSDGTVVADLTLKTAIGVPVAVARLTMEAESYRVQKRALLWFLAGSLLVGTTTLATIYWIIKRRLVSGVEHLRSRLRAWRESGGATEEGNAALNELAEIEAGLGALEARTRRSEEFYRRIIEAQTDLLVRFDLRLRLTFVNEPFRRLAGLASGVSVEGRLLSSLFRPECLEPFYSAAAQAAAAATPRAAEHFLIGPEDRRSWILWQFTCTRPDGGAVSEVQAVGRDITDRREVEEKLAGIAENVPGAVFEIERDRSGTDRFAYLSAGAEQIMGLPLAEITLQRLRELRHPADRDRVLEEVAKAVRDGRPYNIEYRLCRPDGRTIWVLSHATGERRTDGTTIFRGVLLDITARKEAEEKLAQIAASAPGMMFEFIISADLSSARLLYASEGCRALYGLDPREATLEALRALRIPEDDAAAMAISRAALARGEPYSEQFRIRRDGHIRNVLVQVAPAGPPEPDGSRRYVGFASDVTSQRQAEAERDRFALMAESAGDLLGISTIDGIITYLNPAGRRMFGIASPEEALGRHVRLLYADSYDEIRPAILRAILREGRWRGQHLARRHDTGAHFEVEQIIFPLRDPGTGKITHLAARIRDVTLERAQQRALLAAKDAAEAADRAKSEFLAVMSHEIRTPMNGVIGFTELLKATELTAEQREYVETIDACGSSLLGLINAILDFSKIESGKFELVPTPLDPVTATREVVDLLQPRARQKGITLKVVTAPGLPERLETDPQRLRQVLINLVGNAVKFTERGGVVVELTPESAAVGTPASVRFAVRDSGIGIRPEDQARLFRPFTQVDSSTSRRYEGTGLGLAIVENLVRALGGRVGLLSELGRGSTFWFTLPLVVTAAEPARPAASLEAIP